LLTETVSRALKNGRAGTLEIKRDRMDNGSYRMTGSGSLSKKLLIDSKTYVIISTAKDERRPPKQMNKDAKRDTVLAVLAILIFIAVAVLEAIL
jgi:hypothetical protein